MESKFTKQAIKAISGMDGKTKKRIKAAIDPDDILTQDDIEAHRQAMEEYARGELVDSKDIDWD